MRKLPVIELSVIVPCYFCEASIGALCAALVETLAPEIVTFEIVLVNDGSTDRTDTACRAIVAAYPRIVRYAPLSRNFSEHNAVMAGLNLCRGNFAVIIDDDFQNPPAEILMLYRRIKKTGADVVYSRYDAKQHHWFRNLGSWFNGKVAGIVLDKPKDLYLSSFKIIRRRLIDEVILYKGPLPYVDGLILRATHHIETQLVEHLPRRDGVSNYTLRKLFALWSNMFINFSVLPLRFALYLGMGFSMAGLVAACFCIAERLRNPALPMGWASIIVCLLIFSGVQLFMMGLIGEFLGRLYLTETRCPQYVIREVVEESQALGVASNLA